MSAGYTPDQAKLLIRGALTQMVAPYSIQGAALILEDVTNKKRKELRYCPFPPDIQGQTAYQLNDLWPVFRSLIPKGRYGVTVFDSSNRAIVIDSQVWEKTIDQEEKGTP